MTPEVLERLSQSLADRYRVERELGAGGMATVYLAHDLRHDRRVAVKVLKPELAAVLGAERFVVEIKTTASLQHPHILPLFDSGTADGFLFYVMPYIEGETLREKLNRERQLGVDEALKITTEVADALDYAHRHGVIHRDIKPENILLHDGRPMVADFGIALAVSAAAGGRMTETGLSLGTPHYMSPEQATAEKDITGRSDVYSLASVLYEMLSGQPPHLGGTAQQIIMRIIADTPRDVSELRRAVPSHVAAAVGQALEKLPADRFATAKEFAEALRNTHFTPHTATRRNSVSRAMGDWMRDRRSWAAMLALVLFAAALMSLWGRDRGAGDSRSDVVTRFAVTVPGGLQQLLGECDQLALSPDGNSLAFAADGKLWLRSFDSWEAKPLAGADRASAPGFAPDGRAIMYSAGSALERVSLVDGTVTTVANLSVSVNCNETWWADDGAVAFRPAAARDLMLRLPEAKAPVPLTSIPVERRVEYHTWPQLVDDGRAVLYTMLGVSGLWSDAKIVLEDVKSHQRTVVVERGTYGRFVTPGFVLYADVNGAVMALPYDVQARRATGEAFAVAKGVRVGTWGGSSASFAVSRNGATAAFAFGSNEHRTIFEWVDRSGRLLRTVGEPTAATAPLALSPDERQAATVIVQQNNADVWIFDTQSGERRRLTTAPGYDWTPVWSPDGQRLAYPVTTDSGIVLHVLDVNGRAAPKALYRTDSDIAVLSWTRDGWILMQEGRGQLDIRAVQSETPHRVRSVLATAASERNAVASPDGRWMAYQSDESGAYQVYVVSLVQPGRAEQVSTAGGTAPRWSARSNELFYRAPSDTLMVVSVRPGPMFAPGRPVGLFKLENVESDWAVMPSADGQRFLIGRQTAATRIPQVHVVRNFGAVLRAGGKR